MKRKEKTNEKKKREVRKKMPDDKMSDDDLFAFLFWGFQFLLKEKRKRKKRWSFLEPKLRVIWLTDFWESKGNDLLHEGLMQRGKKEKKKTEKEEEKEKREGGFFLVDEEENFIERRARREEEINEAMDGKMEKSISLKISPKGASIKNKWFSSSGFSFFFFQIIIITMMMMMMNQSTLRFKFFFSFNFSSSSSLRDDHPFLSSPLLIFIHSFLFFSIYHFR